jgi:hypothetical protein
MLVSAVNGVYQYSTTYQMQIFGNSISNDDLNDLMSQFGISQTGDEYLDISELYDAMYAFYQTQQNSQINSQAQNGENATNVPWADVMKEVGLSATGNLDDDYSNFTKTISSIEDSTKNEQDKAEVAAFAQTAQSYFVQNNSSETQMASSSDIIAEMNKSFLGFSG